MLSLPSGARFLLNAISEEEEKLLLEKFVNYKSWSTSIGRRVIHFGHQYKYFATDKSQIVDPIPDWLPLKGTYDQVIVNEYNPGQGIAPHIDHLKLFGDQIATLSLGSDIMMIFEKNGEEREIYLPRRSLLTLTGDSRKLWKHSIPKVKIDFFKDGKVIERKKRVSITYRHMK